jgi:type IV secretion system protein VirD4
MKIIPFHHSKLLLRRKKNIDKDAAFELNKGGVVIGMKKEGDKERIYFVGEDSHLLCIGATRSGKSRCLVVQSICTLGLAGESIVVSDPKAELYDYTAEFLQKLGYDVLVIDFKNPQKSMRYNLLQPIINAINEYNTDKAEMLAWDLTNNLVGKPEGEKIWTNGECSIIAAAILCVVCDNKNRPDYQNMTNVYWFIAEMVKTIGNKMPLLEYVKKLPPTHPAKALMSISDVAPSRTRGSFYTSALTTLRLFTSKSIYSITHTSDFQLSDIGQKKQALFIILPDEKTTFYPVASLIVSQLYELLANLADTRGGRLKQRVNFMIDEFGNFTTISDFTNKLTVGAGRGMRFNLFIQSFSQLKEKYDENVSDTIKANCQTWVYLQADDPDTLRDVSEKLGTYTTSSYQLSANHAKYTTPSSSQSISLTERKLLNSDEVRRVKRPYQIVTSRTHPALMYAPDLSEWYFNKMLGLGDEEHNRKLREERESKRPVITDTSKEITLWNIWIYYQKDIMRKLQQQKTVMGSGQNAEADD